MQRASHGKPQHRTAGVFKAASFAADRFDGGDWKEVQADEEEFTEGVRWYGLHKTTQ